MYALLVANKYIVDTTVKNGLVKLLKTWLKF